MHSKTIGGRQVRWNEQRAQAAYAAGHWRRETLGDSLRAAAVDTPERILLIDGALRIDCVTLHREATQLARVLVSRLPAGCVVSFMLPNWHEAATIYLATGMAGMVAHPILPWLRERELAFMLDDADSRMIFIPGTLRGHDYPAMLERVAGSLKRPPELVVVRDGVTRGTAYRRLLETPADVPLPVLDADGVSLMLHTSGTTGTPKAVLHSHNSIHAVVQQIGRRWHVAPGDAFLVASPVSHIGGSLYAFECPLLLGSQALLMERWDADQAVQLALREHCTHMAGATPFLSQLLAAARRQDTTLPDLKVFICGGASVPPTLIREAHAYFAKALVTRVYGSTEVPVTTVGSTARADAAHAAETDGQADIATVKLVGDSGAVGPEGEIWARGPQMLVGYLHPEGQEQLFDADGFFRTGDLGRWQDGDYLVVSGRKKDIIIRNGENISPKEVEDLLCEHPAIAEVAIVGLPHPLTGERACAVIVPRDIAPPDVAALGTFLKSRGLATFKIPEQVEIWPALPKNDAGKVLKHRVQALLIEQSVTTAEGSSKGTAPSLRQQARAWLADNIPTEPLPEYGPATREFVLRWQRRQAEGGWAGISWPKQFGGRGASVIEQIIWFEEYARANAPSPLDASFVGLNHAGPTLIACGTPAQKAFHLPKILGGEVLWCQGFSEPGAGSDLGAIQTRGVVDGDTLVINGHKLWSSYADIADYQELLVRTDPGAKHTRALSWIICPMGTPGMTVRPIKTMAGPAKFCEVFYDNVRVPLGNIVGPLHGGWQVAMSTLAFERGTASIALLISLLLQVEELLKACPADRGALRSRLAHLRAEGASIRAMAYRLALDSAHTVPDSAGSLVRLSFAEFGQRVTAAALELYGLDAPQTVASHGLGYLYLDAFAETIAGGTAEIQRNIIAERLLGLPKGPR